MILKQGQEVRDAADPSRIGIVVGTGSSLGARVLWCFDERLTWTSERPVVLPQRTPDDARFRPVEGDLKAFTDNRSIRFISNDDGVVYYVNEDTGTLHHTSMDRWSSMVHGFKPVR